MKCDECKWDYPAHFLSQMHTNNIDHADKMICGICALAITNAIHSIVRTKFSTGGYAEGMRQDALRWRKKHPEQAPKEEKA